MELQLRRRRQYDPEVNIARARRGPTAMILNNRMVSAVDRNADGTLIQEAAYVYDGWATASRNRWRRAA